MNWKKIRLSKEEKEIEREIDKYVPGSEQDFKKIAEAIERRKKDAILSIRVNRTDLNSIKQKAQKLGVGYQTLISELIHRASL